MTARRVLTDDDLNNIKAAAKGEDRHLGVFTHPADTLKLVAEVHRLRAAMGEIVGALPEVASGHFVPESLIRVREIAARALRGG